MKTDKLTNTIALYLLIAFVAAAILGFFVVKPTYTAAQKTRQEVAKVKNEIKGLEQLETDTEELRVNYASVREERDRILALLPPETQEEHLLVLLNNLAQASNVVLTTFAPNNTASLAPTDAAQSSLSIYDASINVSGSYPAAEAFLSKVEDGARFVELQGGSFSVSNNASVGQVSAKIDLKAYYQTKTGGTNGGQ